MCYRRRSCLCCFRCSTLSIGSIVTFNSFFPSFSCCFLLVFFLFESTKLSVRAYAIRIKTIEFICSKTLVVFGVQYLVLEWFFKCTEIGWKINKTQTHAKMPECAMCFWWYVVLKWMVLLAACLPFHIFNHLPPLCACYSWCSCGRILQSIACLHRYMLSNCHSMKHSTWPYKWHCFKHWYWRLQKTGKQ